MAVDSGFPTGENGTLVRGLPPGKLLALLSQPLLFTALCPLRKLATISLINWTPKKVL
jgi:hypothetical protein